MSRPRSTLTGLALVFALALGCSRQSASPTSPTGHRAVDADAAPDGSTLKAPPPVPISPVADERARDFPTLTAKPTAMGFDGSADNLHYRFEVYDEGGIKIQDSGLLGKPSFQIPVRLGARQRHTWRVRAELQGRVSPWSESGSFVSFEAGYLRGSEVHDPLHNGVTVGERVGPTTFLPDEGIRLETPFSHVRYVIPTTITSGEFSMEVVGLRGNAPGDKMKVFGMSTNSADFITDPNRFDVQYRGVISDPANAITFRALYGSAEDPDLAYEPDISVRFSSVHLLDPNTVYFWKATWGTEVRVVLREGGINGPTLYDVVVPAPRGTYNPQPHYAYLGAPVGRSGPDSGSITGAIYRNVWIGARPRP